MTYLVGIGNAFRGEDGFGHDVVKAFVGREDCFVMQILQLLPEQCLELKDAQQIIFVDAAWGQEYILATPLPTLTQGFSHQLTPFVFIELLKKIYEYKGKYFIYSMQTKNFEKIVYKKKYEEAITQTVDSILKLVPLATFE